MNKLKSLTPRLRAFAVIFLLTCTSALADQLIFIPFASVHYDGSHYWTNILYPSGLDTVTNWQGWEAVNSNFVGIVTGRILVTNQAASVSFSTIAAHDSTTNFLADFSLTEVQKISAGGNVNFVFATNGPGAADFLIWPNGSTRVLSWPTNWALLCPTNGFGVTNGQWQCILTNGNSKAARFHLLAASTADQTNVVVQVTLPSP